MIVYFCGEYVEKSKVAVSPDDRGFLFADGVYEVVRAYQGRFFKLDEHFERLAYGLKELRIEELDVQALKPVATRLLAENGLEKANATLYLQITRGAAPRTHQFPPAGTRPTVYLEVKSFTPQTSGQRTGMTAIIMPDQRWERCDIKSVSLLANTLAFQRAQECGAFEAIFSRNGVLLEGSHSSMLFVKDDVLIFPPLTNHVLASVTRSVVYSLAVAELIPTAIRPCYEHQLPQFQEILMASTTVEIIPIISVNGKKIGGGAPGAIAKKLISAFRKLNQAP
jgi:D-alanine transaminase